MTEYNIRFQTVEFDHGTMQGLGITAYGRRHAIRVRPTDDGQTVAENLRKLANWVEARGVEADLT